MSDKPIFTYAEWPYYEQDNTKTYRTGIRVDVGSEGLCTLVLKARDAGDGNRLAELLNAAVESVLIQAHRR